MVRGSFLPFGGDNFSTEVLLLDRGLDCINITTPPTSNQGIQHTEHIIKPEENSK